MLEVYLFKIDLRYLIVNIHRDCDRIGSVFMQDILTLSNISSYIIPSKDTILYTYSVLSYPITIISSSITPKYGGRRFKIEEDLSSVLEIFGSELALDSEEVPNFDSSGNFELLEIDQHGEFIESERMMSVDHTFSGVLGSKKTILRLRRIK